MAEEPLAAARNALERASLAHADVYVRHLHRGVARFARNTLDQHGETDEVLAVARCGLPGPDGWRLGTVTVGAADPDALVNALLRARDLAARAPPGAWPGFALPESEGPTPPRWDAATASASPAARTEAVRAVVARAREAKLEAHGLLATSELQVAVANTAGVRRAFRGTLAACKVFALDADGVSGYGIMARRAVGALDPDAVARTAVDKCLAGTDPVTLPPGAYDVVLEPSAVAELLEWLGFVTFHGGALRDGTSALGRRLGERVTGERVTVTDDATGDAELAFGVPFDRDGVTRQRVALIDQGVARGLLHDRVTGAHAGAPSTGHAPWPGEGDDPTPAALAMEGGDRTPEALLRDLHRGLLVTRFHYVNGMLDPLEARMTGLTRDGTFLVEGGERTRAVATLRFTERVLDAFGRAEALSSWREAVPTWWSEGGAVVAPTVLLRGFHFTGNVARG
jgi:predicted Zn-dependent protease